MSTANDWRGADGVLFDVEGTLVDAVMPTLRCWQETLRAHGLEAGISALHGFSGMDGNEMLKRLFPTLSPEQRKALTGDQGQRYRRDYLPLIQPLDGVYELFAALKEKGYRIGLATDCQPDELSHYLAILKIAPFVDAAACGSDAEQGKPAPQLITIARERLAAGAPVMVGDTPYDAQAARAAGIAAIGVGTGGFDEAELRQAGCGAVFSMAADMARVLQRPP
jgi:HAD superfamily hydrolase (TIGR01549 family)